MVLNIASSLVRHAEDVTLIAIDGRGPLREEVPEGVRVVDLERSRARKAPMALARALRVAAPSVVFSSQTHLNLLIALVRRTLPPGTITVMREPQLLTGQEMTRGRRSATRFALRSADVRIASSDAMQQELLLLLDDRRPVHVLPNPVDVIGLRRLVGPGNVSTPDPKRPERLQVVVVGRLVEGKGHADLLAAIAALPDGSLELIVIGDGPLRAHLEGRTRALGLERSVRYLGRIDDRAVLARAIAASDLLVQPSRREGLPNAVLEALALGTPVLATTDLVMLEGLATEVGEEALRLVPRSDLGAALAATRMARGPIPRANLLPDRFALESVVTGLIAIVARSDA